MANYKPRASWYPRSSVAKRSPILGYNHNVKYRGLIFHVQTEDSGVLSPHLFTHLFHGGVIVSTRKLVYDAGASSEAIKALMQAQHKAVLKDLNKGAFDLKIDQYLGGTPGLEPRNPALGPPPAAIDRESDEPAPVARGSGPQSAPEGSPAVTGSRAVPPIAAASDDDDGDLVDDRSPTLRRIAQDSVDESAITTRLDVEPAGGLTPPSKGSTARTSEPGKSLPRDGAGTSEQRSDRAPPSGPPQRKSGSTLPVLLKPTRPASNPGAAAAGAATSRPVAPEPRRNHSDAAEIYAPAPPAVEPPPGERSVAAGQYAMKRAAGQASAVGTSRPQGQAPDLSSSTARGMDQLSKAASSGAAQRPSPPPPPLAMPRTATLPMRASFAQPSRSPVPAQQPPAPSKPAMPSPAMPSPAAPSPAVPSAAVPSAAVQRTAPPSVASSAASNVVMTRPAVIVGAPANPGAQRSRPLPDDSRGYGPSQGLISEKSLDEVIHAYLSEDGEEP